MENIRKLVFIADIHIGSRPDIKSYYEKELSNFIKEMNIYNPDIIFLAGDLFDKKLYADSEYIKYGIKFVRELYNNTTSRICIINGTYEHERETINLFIPYSDNRLKIYKVAMIDYIDNMNILFIPEEYVDKTTYYKDLLDKKVDITVGHGAFSFAGFYFKENRHKKNYVVFETDDFKNSIIGAVFGHVHTRTKSKNCQYVGSFSRDSFGEEEDKGYLIIEYDCVNKKKILEKFIKNKEAPLYNTINADKIPFDNITNYLLKEIKDANKLRIIIDNDITVEKYNDIRAFAHNHKEIVIDKRFRGVSKSSEVALSTEQEQRKIERQNLLNKYKDKSFLEVTIDIAKEKFNIDLTPNEINDLVYKN
jgi:DNA repair exonuclease SbcCD nuclease subunit